MDVCRVQTLRIRPKSIRKDWRLPPLKLFAAGERNDTLWKIIEKNVRIPIQVFGDIRAQLAACEIAERQVIAQVQRYGLGETQALMSELLDYSERMTRAALSELPDGEWCFEDWIDDDGIDVESLSACLSP